MTDVFDDLAKAFKAGLDAGRSESADEIERLRAVLCEIMVLSNKRSPHPMSAEADYFRIARTALGENK